MSAIIGLLVAFSVPLWQALFVNAPSLSVEINAIKRAVSDAAVVSLDDYPDLKPLVPVRDLTYYSDEFETPLSRSGKPGETLSGLEQLLARSKQRMRDLPMQIEERKKELDRVKGLTVATITK